MTVSEVKKLVKEKYGKDITDEQALEIINKSGEASLDGELSDEQLEDVAGGKLFGSRPIKFKPNV